MKNSMILRHPDASLPIKWHIAVWFIAVHVLGVVAIWYLLTVHFKEETVILAVLLFVMCHISITAGVHKIVCSQIVCSCKAVGIYITPFVGGNIPIQYPCLGISPPHASLAL